MWQPPKDGITYIRNDRNISIPGYRSVSKSGSVRFFEHSVEP